MARLQDEKDADRKRECELQRERRAAARAAEPEKKAQQEQERTRRNSIARTKISISEARGGLTRTSGAALLSQESIGGQPELASCVDYCTSHSQTVSNRIKATSV